ncbi:MAG TPA: hypothetical protein VK815_13065 [Candidatus Acidoferrales bacterium]|jgi:hypothetical protein|nr:hypothetical protein [Candidatus Acidoferrales bacterium]
MLPKKLKSLALLSGALLSASVAFAQQDNKALLDLLVKKGIITQQEAGNLQSEINAPVAPAPTAGSPATTPTVVTTTPSGQSPLYFQIGAAKFTPFGFLDLTTVYRTTNVGSGIGTSFASIPYSNSTAGQLSETRFSAQNSRLGLRVDSDVGDAKVLGYVESDFLGQTPTAVSQTSNSDLLRLRIYFVDVRFHDWEVLAGQDWSMLTPNRKGLSPVPSDIFYTQNMDTNYQAGLIWARQPQVRVVYHPSDEFAVGLSLENPDQFVGSAVTLPTANFSATQVDNGANGVTTPNSIPDVIVKAAYDTKFGSMPFHGEVAGLYREFRINSFGTTINSDSSASGYGGSINMDLGILPKLHLIENAFWSDGGGRYTGGLAPDLIVRAPTVAGGANTISPVHSASGILGFEWQVLPKTMLAAYYSLEKISQDFQQTGPTTFVGYGFPGSPNSQNRSIEEYTVDAIETFWKDPNHGALQLITQASYLDRKPWVVNPGTPSDAHLLQFFVDVRYVLP